MPPTPPPPTAAPFSHLCVFCGASDGAHPEYRRATVALGQAIARRKITLVYGGGAMGLMGAVADAALERDGRVVGVITELLHGREVAHTNLTELTVVKTMHERKRMMAAKAGGFIVLPGGFGTLDEMFEIIAWAQLGIHHLPIGLLNVNGFYDKLLEFLDHAGAQGFLRLSHREQIFADSNPDALIDRMGAAVPRARVD